MIDVFYILLLKCDELDFFVILFFVKIGFFFCFLYGMIIVRKEWEGWGGNVWYIIVFIWMFFLLYMVCYLIVSMNSVVYNFKILFVIVVVLYVLIMVLVEIMFMNKNVS